MSRPSWNILVFMLNSLVFMLIGMQISDGVEKLKHYTVGDLVLLGSVVSIAAILVRFAWVFTAAYLPRLSRSWRSAEPWPKRKELTVISWCGMRGIVSLAAAFALPIALPDGHRFPHRDLIVFLTFFVIATTLVGQGLSMPLVIRRLRVGSKWSLDAEQRRVRASMGAAALTAIDQVAASEPLPPEWIEPLRQEIGERVALATPDDGSADARHALTRRLRRLALAAEREELIRLWRENEIGDEVLHHLEEILDHQEIDL